MGHHRTEKYGGSTRRFTRRTRTWRKARSTRWIGKWPAAMSVTRTVYRDGQVYLQDEFTTGCQLWRSTNTGRGRNCPKTLEGIKVKA